MAFRGDSDLLFCNGDLSEGLRRHQKKIDDMVNNLQEDRLAATSDEILIEELEQQLRVQPITLAEDQATMEKTEIKIDVSQMPRRNPFHDSGPIYVPGVRVKISIPFQGNAELWNLRPNSWQTTFPRGNVRPSKGKGGILQVVYEFPSDEDAGKIKQEHERNLDDVRFYLNSQRTQIESELSQIPSQIATALTKRRERLKKHDNLSELFGVPLIKPNNLEKATSVTTPASPVENDEKLPAVGSNPHDWDIFISHASEDKDEFVRPLADALIKRGKKVWFDEFTLKVGDSLRRSIDHGLSKSKYGIVVISQAFFVKEWPQKELDGLSALEVAGRKVILPCWHNITADEVRKYSPMLADRLATSSSKSLSDVVNDLLKAME